MLLFRCKPSLNGIDQLKIVDLKKEIKSLSIKVDIVYGLDQFIDLSEMKMPQVMRHLHENVTSKAY